MLFSPAESQFGIKIAEAVKLSDAQGDCSVKAMEALLKQACQTARRLHVSAYKASILFTEALFSQSLDGFAPKISADPWIEQGCRWAEMLYRDAAGKEHSIEICV
jgi:hypothetical protein